MLGLYFLGFLYYSEGLLRGYVGITSLRFWSLAHPVHTSVPEFSSHVALERSLCSLSLQFSRNGGLPLLGVWVISNKFKTNVDKLIVDNYVKRSQEKPDYLGLCSLNPLWQVPGKPESSPETNGSTLSL